MVTSSYSHDLFLYAVWHISTELENDEHSLDNPDGSLITNPLARKNNFPGLHATRVARGSGEPLRFTMGLHREMPGHQHFRLATKN
jgi:hypothetical protein